MKRKLSMCDNLLNHFMYKTKLSAKFVHVRWKKESGTENRLKRDGGTEEIIRKCPKATPAMTMQWDMKCFW